MNNYKIERMPTRPRSSLETWMMRIGAPLAAIAFVWIYWFASIPFLDTFDVTALTGDAIKRFETLGESGFSRINYAMLAIFVASVILWITEAVPSYLTSLFVILAIVLTGVTTERAAYANLGHPVMWLNLLSFVLASMLVKTQVAKRFALWFVVHFGKNATWIFFSFIVINVVLSAFISATTAKAAILLPIFMVIAAIYGSTGGENRNNFGRNIVLQNLFQINMTAGGFMTGSGANLLAAAMIIGAGGLFGYQQWFVVAFPMCLLLVIIGWIVGTKIYFPLKKGESVPQIQGGMQRLKEELHKLGTMKFVEYKAVAIFVGVLFMWTTKGSFHNISETAVAFIGAVIALTPGIGIVKWNDVDVPWHLLLFSAGAYTLGSGLDSTNLAGTMIDTLFTRWGLTDDTPFWILFTIITGAMLFSALIFQSKTMRCLIFIPIAIGIAQRFGFPIVSLAVPVALLIEHVYVLPFNSKPAVLLYGTNHYSWADTFKFGFTMMIIAWIVLFIWGQTVMKWLGYLPNGVFY
ncbi:MAG: DASS family sodium-coupled anion symporter [Bacteroidales bacterium]|nr:DASS family sodium-coupled anion symporter [Bacteroidales bacterium]